MKLTFYGGVKEVTGSNYLLEHEGTKILVDCGLKQGDTFSEKQNWDPFPYDPKEISAVILTHAHIDHSGRLPKLAKEGFAGTVYSTFPTRDFAHLLLLDSEHLLAQTAERHGKEPLYAADDVEKLMRHWHAVNFHEQFAAGPFQITLYNSAHILGSSIVVIEAAGKKIVFSGDLGNSPAPIIGSPEAVEEADYCVIESTYGNIVREPHKEGLIEDAIEETVHAGGTLLIPAFAMERTQKLLFEIDELAEHGRIPKVPIFLDSPLAIKITEVYKRYQNYFDKKTANLLKGDNLLFDFPGLQKTLATEESKSINSVRPPKIIIAGSGMSQGGRILHHEKRYLPDPKSAILFIGYQSQNSLGRRIQEGAKSVQIHGEEVPVRCRVITLSGYSAHADQRQLLEWIGPMRFSLKKLFVVQGEEEQGKALVQKIINDLAIHAEIPAAAQAYEL